MKLTAKNLKQLILEVINESRVDKKPTAFVNGYTQGSRDAERLAKKGEKQSTEGLQAYIQKATENHPNEKWRQGYAFAFKLMFSKQLSTPPTKGQLPFANAPSRPYNIKLRKEEMEDDDILQTILSLIDSGSVAQAFEFADDLDMEKELVQTMLKNIKTSAKGNTTLDVSDEAAVALVEYLKDRPEVDSGIKDWLSFGLPFKKPGPPPNQFPMVPHYDMYRGYAYFMLKNIMGEYERVKTLQESCSDNISTKKKKKIKKII